MNYVTKRKCEVIYLRGNHDDFLDEFIPFKMKRFFITDKYVLESQNKKYLVIHGDIFDSITSNLKWISRLGDVGYTFLLWLNRYYNQYRVKRGLPYYSLSQKIKAKVKSAVNFISDFETKLSKLAEDYKYDGIICGHIHQPANKMMNGIHYLNSGDWVETLSALAEDQEGNWSVIYYEDWLKEFQQTNETLTFTLNFSETNPPSGLINLGI
jgi:UDP-2,3-diacylglucosamine pyrophosphatase LpxH